MSLNHILKQNSDNPKQWVQLSVQSIDVEEDIDINGDLTVENLTVNNSTTLSNVLVGSTSTFNGTVTFNNPVTLTSTISIPQYFGSLSFSGAFNFSCLYFGHVISDFKTLILEFDPSAIDTAAVASQLVSIPIPDSQLHSIALSGRHGSVIVPGEVAGSADIVNVSLDASTNSIIIAPQASLAAVFNAAQIGGVASQNITLHYR